jgi:hypothetical protein
MSWSLSRSWSPSTWAKFLSANYTQQTGLSPNLPSNHKIMNLTSLFTALRLGALELPHRIVLALLTRMRAGAGGVPTAMNATYYGSVLQRL